MSHYDPDIGLCDDCGSDEGRRRRSIATALLGGVPTPVGVWLCDSCIDEPAAPPRSAEGRLTATADRSSTELPAAADECIDCWHRWTHHGPDGCGAPACPCTEPDPTHSAEGQP